MLTDINVWYACQSAKNRHNWLSPGDHQFPRYFVGVLIAFSSQIGKQRLKTSSMQQFQNDQKTIYAYNNVLQWQ